jgi:hypothetical protein
MIASHPYVSWPLRATFFTEEALKAWNDATRTLDLKELPLPPGFSHTVELEGVDGKSGQRGSGRSGPIDVTDNDFTELCLRKHAELLSSTKTPSCSICSQNIDNYASEPLSIALCSNPRCSSTSHLTCLSTRFSSQRHGHEMTNAMIPRGGNCPQCHEYTLWGDIIRGCYRRKAGSREQVAEEEDMFLDDDDNNDGDTSSVAGISPGDQQRSKQAQRRKRRTRLVVDEGEFFDLDAVSGSDEQEAETPPLRPHLSHPVPRHTFKSASMMASSETIKEMKPRSRMVPAHVYHSPRPLHEAKDVGGPPSVPKKRQKRHNILADRDVELFLPSHHKENSQVDPPSELCPPRRSRKAQAKQSVLDRDLELYASDSSVSGHGFSRAFSSLSVSSPPRSPAGKSEVIMLSE